MTESQREMIEKMRGYGLGYKKIAQMLDLSPGTVQSYCRRNSMVSVSVPAYDTSRCRQCGKPLVQKEKAKKRKFCSDECRIKWWTAHPCVQNGNTKSSHLAVCEHCGKTYTAYGNAPRKYCSRHCYIDARFRGDMQ